MEMPGRKIEIGVNYRYGFNGKENDNEVRGEGNQQDYGMRIYDPRLGRFLSVDPLRKKYPWYTPYQFAGNMPIRSVDLDGGEPQGRTETWVGLTWTVLRTGKQESGGLDMAMGWNWNYEAIYDKTSKQAFYIHYNEFDQRYYYWNAQDPTLMYRDENGNANGYWEPFETQNETEMKAAGNSVDFLSTMFAGLFTAPFAIGASPGATAGLLSSRGISVGVDYASQVGGNYISGRRGADAWTNINLTSLAVSALNPTSSWKGLFLNNLASSTFSFSATEGYNGIGAGKGINTILLQTGLSTLAGKATSGIEIGISNLKVRINHVNNLYGEGSTLSNTLQGALRNLQYRSTLIGVGLGSPANGLNNQTEKKQ